MEAQWSEEQLKLLDQEMEQVLNTSVLKYHKVELTVDQGGKHKICLIKEYDNVCKGYFGDLVAYFPPRSPCHWDWSLSS